MSSPDPSSRPDASDAPLIDNVLARCVSPRLLRYLSATWISALIFTACGGFRFAFSGEKPDSPADGGLTWASLKFVPIVVALSYVAVSAPAAVGWFLFEHVWTRLFPSSTTLWFLPSVSAGLGAAVSYGVLKLLDFRGLQPLPLIVFGGGAALAAAIVNCLFFRPVTGRVRTSQGASWGRRRIVIATCVLAALSVALLLLSLYIYGCAVCEAIAGFGKPKGR